jgi:hypothetical protein
MVYTCRMHPEIRLAAPGKCPKCRGCDLVPLDEATAAAPAAPHQQHAAPAAAAPAAATGLRQYLPLLTIVGLILLAALAASAVPGPLHWHRLMTAFMAGFFLVFAGFKLLDLPGFAAGYGTYDLLAKRLPAYGYVYPFIELGLGLAYLTGFQPRLTNLTALVVMGFSSLGVMQVMRERRTVMCACLGTAIKLPLTTVTLTEDLGMAAMALLGLALA